MKVRINENQYIPKEYWYHNAKGCVFEVIEKNIVTGSSAQYTLTDEAFQIARLTYNENPYAIGYCIDASHCEILFPVKENDVDRKIRRFPTGAIRSDNTGRERFDFISPLALKELAQFLSTTENAFAQVNYFKGIPEDACIESALRHINDFRINGKKEEAVALLFNAVALVHTICLKERGEYKEIYPKTELINQSDFKEE